MLSIPPQNTFLTTSMSEDMNVLKKSTNISIHESFNAFKYKKKCFTVVVNIFNIF